MIILERLKFLLHYDPATGKWTWLNRPSKTSNIKIGSEAGCVADGRRRIRIDGRYYKASRLAYFYMTGGWPDALIDHKNRTPLDESFDNLRTATRPDNRVNSAPIGVSGFKGVYPRYRRGKTTYEVYVLRPRTFIGAFADPLAAAKAYDEAATRHYGEFAFLNFPAGAN